MEIFDEALGDSSDQKSLVEMENDTDKNNSAEEIKPELMLEIYETVKIKMSLMVSSAISTLSPETLDKIKSQDEFDGIKSMFQKSCNVISEELYGDIADVCAVYLERKLKRSFYS